VPVDGEEVVEACRMVWKRVDSRAGRKRFDVQRRRGRFILGWRRLVRFEVGR